VLVRDILERVADKWTLLVIDALDGRREVRFSRLRERIGGISQKMLTKTLRQLERDGLVKRRIHAEVPPRVDYKLTPLGEPRQIRVQHLDVGRSTEAGGRAIEAHVRHVRAIWTGLVSRDKRKGQCCSSARNELAPTMSPQLSIPA
jgi:DNA-binding HxlR family transcriptional regulator